MIGSELITEFETLADDANTDQTQVLRWINQSYDRINSMRVWNFLRKEDSSKTVIASTVSYAVPTDFMFATGDYVYLLNSSNQIAFKLKIVAFQDRLKYINQLGYVYFDIVSSTLVFTAPAADLGEYVGKTIQYPYQYQPAQLTTATGPVFNRAYHEVLVYHAAKHFWYAEQDERDRSYHREMHSEYATLLKELKQWDNRLNYSTDPSYIPEKSWIPEVS